MADRDILFSISNGSSIGKLLKRQGAARTLLSSIGLALLAGGLCWVSSQWAARAASVTTLTLNAMHSAPWQDEKDKGAVIAGFEGSFDPRTRQMVIQGGPAITERIVRGRSNPNQEVPRNTAYTFSVVNSTYLSSGDNAGNISGEIRLNNQSGSTLYNTRILFTRFRLCPQTGACDGNTAVNPANYNYYNDGLIPYQGKLHVSRAYGDIPSNGNSSAVWTFNLNSQPLRFFFAFVVLSDWGVAAESVYPAAVQVNANNGAGVVIRGRGFSGTPTVSLLDANGLAVANLSNVVVTNDTQITANVPAGTAPGIYSVRVTLAGGTVGGQGSSIILNRLTVTGVPSATLSGTVNSLPNTGPFLVTSDVTLGSNANITGGTVFYVSNGARVLWPNGAAPAANGGVPGVPNADTVVTPTQIVFTAQRSPGAGLPSVGAWGGIDLTASGPSVKMRNVVVEYGGGANTAGVFLTGSGRTLQFTDGILRFSAGSGLAANGPNDSLIGFARNRIEYNGQSAATPALLLSGNAALGLYEIPDGGSAGTTVSDGGYFYSSTNDFTENSLNAVQIGTDGNAASNDFSRSGSGVLVGQGNTPIQLRGSNSNPAIVGVVPPAAPTELTIGPTALIQLAGGVDFQAGDYSGNRVGCISANGFAGVNQVNAASLTNSKYIVFDRIGAGGNFGSIFFARNSLTSCLLSFVQVRNGGASVKGNGAVISEGAVVTVRNTQVTGSSTGGIIETQGGLATGIGTTFASNGSLIIDTIAGGLFGDGNLASEAAVLSPLQVATDTQGRGVFFVDAGVSVPVLRFVNTTRNPVQVAGITIAPGTIKTLAGGGLDINDNAAGFSADLGIVTGLAVSHTGDRVYFIDSITPAIRFLNISTTDITIAGSVPINRGNVGTLAQGNLGATVSGLAVHPGVGDVYFCDAANTGNRVYRIGPTGGTPTLVAGSGQSTLGEAAFEENTAPTALRLLEPRSLAVDGAGNIYVTDTGHNRVINVGVNPARLIVQFPSQRTPPVGSSYRNRPFPAGLALVGSQLYIANRAAHNIVGTESNTNPTDVAGRRETSCEYPDAASTCGDGGPRTVSQFKFFDSGNVGIAGDANGIFVCDQANNQGLRGRIRYVNVTNNPVEVAGKVVQANQIDTVFGTGLTKPYDTGLANASLLGAPAGVAIDPNNGGLWISEGGNIRFVNRSLRPLTLFTGTPSAVTIQPGRITTVNFAAGMGDSTDGVQIKFGGFDTLQGMWATTQGLYLADSRGGPGLQGATNNVVNRRTSRIRFINTSNQAVIFYAGDVGIAVDPGVVKTIAGGNPDPARAAQDGPNPLEARLVGALDVAVHPTSGDIYLCEAGNKRVRRVNRATGAIASIPSNFLPGATDPGVTNAAVNAYTGLTFDNQGRLLVVDAGLNAVLREKAPGSAFTTGFDTLISGAPLNSPRDVVVDSAGSFAYVTNSGALFPGTGDHRVLRLTLSGNTATAATYAGQPQVKGYSGDFGVPTSALLNLQASGIVITVQGGQGVLTVVPTLGITLGLNGEVIFADSANNAIRRIR